MRRTILAYAVVALSAASAQAQPLPSPAFNNLTVNGTVTAGTLTGNASGANVTATGSTTARTSAEMAADTANAVSQGADQTGIRDSAPAINAALANAATGRHTDGYLPPGTYRIKSQINLGGAYAQCLVGSGNASILQVDSDFDPAALGVIVVAATGASISNQPCLRNIRIQFVQPPELTTAATAAATAGDTTVTVADVTGIKVGQYVADPTHSTAIVRSKDALAGTTVASIAGNVVTLSRAIVSPGVTSGDAISFAPSRAQFATLAQGCTTVAGGTGCKYPWAVYNAAGQALLIDGLWVEAAWNGVYQRASTFNFNRLYVGALNIGLDVDNCFNFPQITNYEFFAFGFDGRYALLGSFYDGATVAANFGETDGIVATNIQTWTGAINLTSTFSWGQFTNVGMDGNNANFNAVGNTNSWAQVTNFYSTKGNGSHGVPLTVSAMDLRMNNFSISSSAINNEVLQTGGVLRLKGGHFFNGVAGTISAISVTGGRFMLSDTDLAMGTNNVNQIYIEQTGGSIGIDNVVFFTSIGGQAHKGIVVADSVYNYVHNVHFHGWDLTGMASPPLGDYDTEAYDYTKPISVLGSINTNGQSGITQPALRLSVVGAAADQSQSDITASGTTLSMRLLKDDLSATNHWLDLTRTGYVPQILTISVPSINLSGTTTLSNGGGLVLNGAAGSTDRTIRYQSAGLSRWTVTASNAESGSNAGSDYVINRYSDAGAFIDGPVSLTRATGLLTVNKGLKLGSQVAVASLPTCDATSKYQLFSVNDAAAPTWNATLVGGGVIPALAFCNGTNWTAH